MRRVARAVLALSVQPGGFTLAQVVEQVRSQSRGDPSPSYSPRQAAYDLQKLRGQQLVRVEPGTRRYHARPSGLRQLSAVLLLREQVLEPLLSATEAKHEPVVSKESSPLDALYEQLRGAMQEVLCHLQFAA